MPNRTLLTQEDRDDFKLRRAHLKERALQEKIDKINVRYSNFIQSEDNLIKLIDAHVQSIASHEEAQTVFKDYISLKKKEELDAIVDMLKIDFNAPESDDDTVESEEETSNLVQKAKQDPRGPIEPNAQKIKQFQAFISAMNSEQHDSFNKWLGRVDKRNSFNAWLESLDDKSDLKKQRKFFKWFDEKNKVLFDYYASRISAPSIKRALKEWCDGAYKAQMDEIERKHKAGDLDSNQIYLEQFDEVSKIVRSQLDSFYSNHLENTASLTFYREENPLTGQELHTQWLDETRWDWQKMAFNCDPEDEINDIALLVLQAQKRDVADASISPLNKALETDMHVYTFTENPRDVDGKTVQNNISVVYDGTSADLTMKLFERYGIMALFDKKPGSSPILPRPYDRNSDQSPFHTDTAEEMSASYVPFENAKGKSPSRLSKGGLMYTVKLDDILQYSFVYDGTSGDLADKLLKNYQITASFPTVSTSQPQSFQLPDRLEANGQELTITKQFVAPVDKLEGSNLVESKQRCKLFSDSQSKFLAACLNENRVALDEYQVEHKMEHMTTLCFACGGYFGEIFYVWFAYIAATQSMAMALELFGVAIDQGSIPMLGAGIIATAYVFAANVTFDPWADTEAAERNILLSKESMFNMLISKRFKEQPVPMTAFAIFATGGVFPELLPAAELAKLMGEPGLNYILAPALMISGLGYYFFFNAGSVHRNTGKGWEAFAKTIHRLMDKDPEVSSIAMVAGLHEVLSFIERAWRIAYGPFMVAGMLGASSGAALTAAGITFVSTLIVSLSTRVYPIEKFYYPEENDVITSEKYQEAKEKYEALKDKSLLEKAKLALDPSSFLAGGVGIILPLILKEALNFSGPLQMGLAVASGIASSMYLIVKFMPAARKKEINREAHGEFELNTQTAIACMIDQGFRAFGMLFTTRAMAPAFVDPSTSTGRIGIIGLLSVELFLSFAAYLYQAEECSQAHKTMGQSIVAWWEGFIRTERGKYFLECGVSLQNILCCCKATETVNSPEHDLDARLISVNPTVIVSKKGSNSLLPSLFGSAKIKLGAAELTNRRENDTNYGLFQGFMV